MTDEFEEMMRAGGLMGSAFEVDEEDVFATGVIPPSVDDHWACHLLEGVVQFTACLYAADYVAPYVEEEVEGFARVMEVGLVQYLWERYGGVLPALGSPEDVELMVWVRHTCGRAAQGLERFLAVHGIRKVSLPVLIDGHGWTWLSLDAGMDDDDLG